MDIDNENYDDDNHSNAESTSSEENEVNTDDEFFVDDEFSNKNDDQNLLLKVASLLYGKANLSIKQAEEIMKLLKMISEETTKECIKSLSCCSSLEEGIELILVKPLIKFDDYLTEHKFKKTLTSLSLYREPIQFSVGNETVEVGACNLQNKPHRGVIMDIEYQIVKFLEIDGILESILEYQESLMCLPNGIYRNFVNGDFWRLVTENNEGKTLIPIFLYNDDFVTDDKKGPHAPGNSLSAFYYMFPTAPPQLASTIDSVFDAMTIKTEDIKKYGNDSPIYALVYLFTKLEVDGITLYKGTAKEKKIHVVLSKLLGDNLGMHAICGFRPVFTTNRPCIICEITSNLLKYSDEVSPDPIRTIAKYNAYFQQQDHGIRSTRKVFIQCLT